MKKYSLIIVLLIFNNTFSQNINYKTLIVTENKTVNLYFQSPIERATVGAPEDYQFGYNKQNADYIGIVKGSKSADSNLTVITVDGNIYSYILKYKKDITVFDYFIKESSAIGNLNNNKAAREQKKTDSISKIEKTKKEIVVKKEKKIKEEKYILTAKSVLFEPTLFRRAYKFNDKIKLHTKTLVYDKDHLYLLVSITNKANIDYYINYLEFYITSKESLKNKTSQKIIIDPVYKYNYKNRINKNESHNFVVVFDKFSINTNKHFCVSLNEKKGEKNITLFLDNKYVNSPKNINY